MNCLVKKPADLAAVNDCEETTLIRLARVDTALGEAARNRLIKRYDRWITQRCMQTLANEAIAYDAAQEVKLSMYKALRKFEGRSSLRTWLNSIIHNQCVSQIRKRQRATINPQTKALITLYENNQRQVQPDTDLPVEAVNQTLKALPVKAREVLQLRFYKELALEEISQVLGISLSSAKMRLYRALEQFKQVFQQFNQELVWGGVG